MTMQTQSLGGQRSLRYPQSKVACVALDLAICACSVMAAYLIRFEGAIPEPFFYQMAILVPIVAVARVIVNQIFGVYRVMWKYMSLQETLRFLRSIALVSTIMLAIRLTLPAQSSYFLIPIGIIIIEGALTFVAMTGVRFLPRIIKERLVQSRGDVATVTLIVGAGEAGIAIAKEAKKHPALGIHPIGFLDDDHSKWRKEIGSLPVLGNLDDLERIIHRTGTRRVIITTRAIAAKRVLTVMDTCRTLGVEMRIVPRLFELLGKKGPAQSLREVRVEDLLSRKPVPPSLSLADLVHIYQDSTIMVTGAGGSIGGELCRQLSLMKPSKLLLVERDETNLFEIHRQIAQEQCNTTHVPLLADITDRRIMERIFKEHTPQVVFHAAAFKHVPMMENFPYEAVRNNMFGTQTLAELAQDNGVESFVMISTDKAVHPTSVMGATKRVAEHIVQAIAKRGTTKFSCVRFGNVLGSRGSVVRIFRDQIEQGGPLTVTHPEATRYFMTIQEASNLVIQAATLGDKGEVFLLDMGEPVRILDLARQMIRLSGATEEEIGIRIVGSRPGEKLYEELSEMPEAIETTPLRRIFRCPSETLAPAALESILEQMIFVTRSRDSAGVKQCLEQLDIGYKPNRSPDGQSVALTN